MNVIVDALKLDVEATLRANGIEPRLLDEKYWWRLLSAIYLKGLSLGFDCVHDSIHRENVQKFLQEQ